METASVTQVMVLVVSLIQSLDIFCILVFATYKIEIILAPMTIVLLAH